MTAETVPIEQRRGVLGVDPGVTTGVALLEPGGTPLVFQCNAAAAWGLVAWLASEPGGPGTGAIEAFVPGRGAGARGTGAGVTRALIGQLRAIDRVTWHVRAAGLVKPWAGNARLEAAGLVEPTEGMLHARDACRHALFCAVRDLGWPDPLSKAGREFWRRR